VRIPSSDHVSVAIHQLGGAGRPLLLSHATGFHGYCYLPVADALEESFSSYALDYRGHGDTARPVDWTVDWAGFGDDALAAATALAPHGGLIGFGHSMGGTALLMAAHRNPRLFDLIVAFEPIVMPPDYQRQEPGPDLATGARRRRPSFGSFQEAMENYRSKPPMNAFDADALRMYVAHGFRPAPEGVRLKCDPEFEAATFEAAGAQQVWDLLPEITTKVLVVAGSLDIPGPAAVAEPAADRLANAAYVEIADLDHFAPFVDPERIARLINDAASDGAH
jgi:pimeloyl-ACP methyl ester carboxylesterase